MNQMFQKLEADVGVSITDLKRNPAAVVKAADDQAIAILSHNKVVAYVIAPRVWEYAQDLHDDTKLNELIDASNNEPVLEVSIDDLSADI